MEIMSDSNIEQTIAIADWRPINPATFEPYSDEEICGKTYYFYKSFIVCIHPKRHGFINDDIRFKVKGFKVEPCELDSDEKPHDFEYTLFDATYYDIGKIMFDGVENPGLEHIPEKFKPMFKQDFRGNIQFKASDTFLVNVYEKTFCSETVPDSDYSIKIDFKNIKEILT